MTNFRIDAMPSKALHCYVVMTTGTVTNGNYASPLLNQCSYPQDCYKDPIDMLSYHTMTRLNLQTTLPM